MTEWLLLLAAWCAVLLLAGAVAQAAAWVARAWAEIQQMDIPAEEREEVDR